MNVAIIIIIMKNCNDFQVHWCIECMRELEAAKDQGSSRLQTSRINNLATFFVKSNTSQAFIFSSGVFQRTTQWSKCQYLFTMFITLTWLQCEVRPLWVRVVSYAVEIETGVLRSKLKKTLCNALINTNILLRSTIEYIKKWNMSHLNNDGLRHTVTKLLNQSCSSSHSSKLHVVAWEWDVPSLKVRIPSIREQCSLSIETRQVDF